MVAADCLLLPPQCAATVPGSASRIFSLPPVANRESISPGKGNGSSSDGSRPPRLVFRISIKGVKKPSPSTSSSSVDQEKPPLAEVKSSEEKSVIKEEKQKKRCRFSLELTKEEIDQDLFAITGKEASSRPRKRSRKVKRDNHVFFPGLSLPIMSKGF